MEALDEGLAAARQHLRGPVQRAALVLRGGCPIAHEGADLRRCDLTQTMVAGAKFARADVRGAELGGLNVKELATIEGMMVSADQQYGLLSALGLDLYAE